MILKLNYACDSLNHYNILIKNGINLHRFKAAIEFGLTADKNDAFVQYEGFGIW